MRIILWIRRGIWSAVPMFLFLLSGCNSVASLLYLSIENPWPGSVSSTAVSWAMDRDDVVITSFGRVNGVRVSSNKWTKIPSLQIDGVVEKIEILDDDVSAIEIMLHRSQNGCISPFGQLGEVIKLVLPEIRKLGASVPNLPVVNLRLALHSSNAAFVLTDRSTFTQSGAITLLLTVPEGLACDGVNGWAISAVDTIFHELTHARNFRLFGQRLSPVVDETIASMVGACAGFLIDKSYFLTSRPTTRPYSNVSLTDAMRLSNDNNIPATYRGRIISDALIWSIYKDKDVNPLLGDYVILQSRCERFLSGRLDVASIESLIRGLD